MGGRVALDLLNRRGRVARVVVPDLRAGGQNSGLRTIRYDNEPALGEAVIEWVNKYSRAPSSSTSLAWTPRVRVLQLTERIVLKDRRR